jgi:peroxiredoxin Q/BCP
LEILDASKRVLVRQRAGGSGFLDRHGSQFRFGFQAPGRPGSIFCVNPQNARSHARFREKYRLPFPLLVDPGRKVAALYQAGGLIVKRTVYLIGPDGVIRLARRGMPKPAELLAVVDQ